MIINKYRGIQAAVNFILKNNILIILAALVVYSGTMSGCSGENGNAGEKSQPVTESRFMLGTLVDLTIYEGENSTVFRKAFNLISEYENMLSRNIDTSEISLINKNAGKLPEPVSVDTLYAINKGLDYSVLTDGLFDISIGPLVTLWGIGTESARLPSDPEIKRAVELTDYKKIFITSDTNSSPGLPAGSKSADVETAENNTSKSLTKNLLTSGETVFSGKSVFLSKEGMAIDLGAVAKGFIADKVLELFKANGVKSAIINLGGNVLLLGTKPEGIPFKIGIQNPFDLRGSYLGIIKASDLSIVTSGIYERYFEADGKKYHHILNPKTGYPVENDIMGISVITGKSIDGDCLSTSLFMLGSVKAVDLVEKLENTEAVIITKDKKIILSSGAEKIFSLIDNDFTISGN